MQKLWLRAPAQHLAHHHLPAVGLQRSHLLPCLEVCLTQKAMLPLARVVVGVEVFAVVVVRADVRIGVRTGMGSASLASGRNSLTERKCR